MSGEAHVITVVTEPVETNVTAYITVRWDEVEVDVVTTIYQTEYARKGVIVYYTTGTVIAGTPTYVILSVETIYEEEEPVELPGRPRVVPPREIPGLIAPETPRQQSAEEKKTSKAIAVPI
jgi:hypothetical protein